jgi:AcrR family transcriptional regulator
MGYYLDNVYGRAHAAYDSFLLSGEAVPELQREVRRNSRGSNQHRDRPFETELARLQRDRIVTAAIEIVGEGGYASLSVAKVVERSHVSRKTFYDLFGDREDCFLAAFEQQLAQAREIVAAAYASQPDWLSGMRAALIEVLDLIEQNPTAAKLCIVDALAAGRRVLDSRAHALEELAGVIDRGPEGKRRAGELALARVVAGALAAALHAHLVAEGPPQANLLGVLMATVALPSLGRSAARAQLAIPAPIRRPGGAPLSSAANPLRALKLRVTYRTIRVMIVIAERPGASNREIARAADIVDQGQISKLLRRLEALGLIENFGQGQLKGRSNSWRLTRLGEELQRATTAGSR